MMKSNDENKFYQHDDSDIKPDENGNFYWKCFVCGAVLKQKEKPEYCPLCKKEETFFFKIDPETENIRRNL